MVRVISRIDLSTYGIVFDDKTNISLREVPVNYEGRPVGKVISSTIDGQTLILEIELDDQGAALLAG